MSFRRAATVTGTFTFLFASAALIAAGCGSSSSSTGTGGATGTHAGGATGTHTGGASGTGTGGHATGGATGATGGATGATGGDTGTGAGGDNGAGGSIPTPAGCIVTSATDTTMPLISDFSTGAPGFGNFTDDFSASYFAYANLTQDLSMGSWHITGIVSDYSSAGFGLQIYCSKVDLSAFDGLQFDIRGTFARVAPEPDASAPADAGTIPSAQATFVVNTAGDTPNSTFTANPTWGTCVPTNNQYDNTCRAPSKLVTLSPTLTTQRFRWTDLAGGRGQPHGSVNPNPAEITGIFWSLPWAGSTSTPYMIDITLDNLSFLLPQTDSGVTNPTDAGTDTSTGTDTAIDSGGQ
jgi:hypothetical protein